MTEITVSPVPAPVQSFVLHWGDMGGYWGVNRSVGQIHAFLYVAEKPLTAEDISNALGMARSNVSNSLKELQAWSLVRRIPIMGDRREHFEAETDIWEVAAKIAAGRKQREIDPALAALRACVEAAQADPATHRVAVERLQAMLEFTEAITGWYLQMIAVPRPQLLALIRLGAKIAAFLPKGAARKT